MEFQQSEAAAQSAAPQRATVEEMSASWGLVKALLRKKRLVAAFMVPVDPTKWAGISDYHDVIKSPMDIGTVRVRVQLRLTWCCARALREAVVQPHREEQLLMDVARLFLLLRPPFAITRMLAHVRARRQSHTCRAPDHPTRFYWSWPLCVKMAATCSFMALALKIFALSRENPTF